MTFQLQDTKDILNLSHEIQKEVPEKNQQIFQGMIERINNFDYGSENIYSIRSGMNFFNFFVFLSPFIVQIFVRIRYVPQFMERVVEARG